MNKRFLTTAAIVLGLAWLIYVIFSEPLARKLCSTALAPEKALEKADTIALYALAFFLVLVPLALLAARLCRSLFLSLRGRAAHTPVKRKKLSSKELVFGITTLLLVSFALIALWHSRYLSFLKSMEYYGIKTAPGYKEPEFPVLDRFAQVNLGWAHYKESHPDHSYILYPEKKKPGTIRVGVFGCSFVHGTEVARGHELPTFLLEAFKAHGAGNVEVLNFGVDGYGMHQAYLLWEWAGKKYDLDYVVFLPMEIHESRDRTFAYHIRNYIPVHARFILQGGEVKMIPVAGTSSLEATALYFGFIPPWRYLRYDEKAPVSLFALLPDRGKDLDNLLYYRSLNKEKKRREALDIYTLLFRKLGSEARNAIIIVQDEHMRELEKTAAGAGISFIESSAPGLRDSFLYRAPMGHHSALGQRVQSDELFDFITGGERASVDHLEIAGSNRKPAFPGMAQPLYTYANVQVGIEKKPVAHFGLPTETCGGEPRCARLLDFKGSRVFSLLQQTEGKITRFVPLCHMLRDREPVSISWKQKNGGGAVPAGTLSSTGGVIGKISFISKEFTLGQPSRAGSPRLFLDSLEMPGTAALFHSPENIKEIEITTGDRPALTGRENPDRRLLNLLRRTLLVRPFTMLVHIYTLLPSAGEYSYLKAGAGEYIDPSAIARREGTVDLLVTGGQGESTSIPMFLDYRLFSVTCPPFRKVFEHGISLPRLPGHGRNH